MNTEIYTFEWKSSGVFWEAILLVIRFSSYVQNIVWPITNPIRFLSLRKKIISNFTAISCLVTVNTNTALTWGSFWNFKRRIQFTKKIPKANVKRPNIKNQSSINTTIISVKVSHASVVSKLWWRIEIASEDVESIYVKSEKNLTLIHPFRVTGYCDSTSSTSSRVLCS